MRPGNETVYGCDASLRVVLGPLAPFEAPVETDFHRIAGTSSVGRLSRPTGAFYENR